jgi:hypothetical protein
MKKPWYIQAIFGAGCFACLALLGIAPFASSKADKALMDFIGAALFAAAFLVVLIYNLIKSGTFLPGLKRIPVLLWRTLQVVLLISKRQAGSQR